MALRKVFESRICCCKVKVFRDSLWDEYIAKIYKLNGTDGTWKCAGDYHTSDKRDALVTANIMLFEGNRKISDDKN